MEISQCCELCCYYPTNYKPYGVNDIIEGTLEMIINQFRNLGRKMSMELTQVIL